MRAIYKWRRVQKRTKNIETTTIFLPFHKRWKNALESNVPVYCMVRENLRNANPP